MSEREPVTDSGSTPLYRSAMVFVAGLALGALMMVEIVPASSLVDLAAVDGVPVDEDSSTGGSGGDQVALGGSSEDPDAPGGATVNPNDSSDPAGSSDPAAPNDPDGPADPDDPADPEDPKDGNSRDGDQKAVVACEAGRNGGATDQGVTADAITMKTTVVESGIGSSFLGETRFAMDAVANRVNRSGGICGRQLDIKYTDDGWDPKNGAQFLRSWLEAGDIFAVPVGPSSEGLNSVIKTSDFDKYEVPVVGTNGLSILQYETADGSAQKWVWPVASATVSSARIMAKDAFDRGATKPEDFSVVFANNYRFGAEGAEAFNAQVKRLTGGDIPGYKKDSTSCDDHYCSITAGDKASYTQEVNQFQPGKFVALFLEPQTARAWMTDNNAPYADNSKNEEHDIPLGFGAAQPLFTREFGDQCGTKCHTMLVWTGFKPYQEHYVSDPDVQRYVNDLEATNRNADPNNQFSMGAYIGMELLVEAIEAVGPELTRQKLKEQLDTMTFDDGLTLTSPMKFDPDNRYVGTTMQAWAFQAVGQFNGKWSAQQIVEDPRFGG